MHSQKPASRIIPDDALAVYEAQAESLVKETHARAYDAAVEQLEKIRALRHRTGQAAAFGQLVQTLRADYRRKRSFIQRLDSKGW